MASFPTPNKSGSQNQSVEHYLSSTAFSSTSPRTPISTFQWLSLARATWMWVLRPLWYLCVVFPSKLLGFGLKMGARSETEERGLLDEHFRKQR